MSDELKAYFTTQFELDDNLIGVGEGLNGQTVVLVQQDDDTSLAPHALRAAEAVKFIKCGPISIGPPYWPEAPAAPEEVKPRDYIDPEDRHRPFWGGVSIAHKDVTAGTTTGFFYDTGTAEVYLASNNHVLANVNRAAIGSAILQPGPADGGQNPSDMVATLKRYVPISSGATVDAAVGKMLDLANVDLNIISIGYIHGVCKAYPGQELIKYGRTSELSRGEVVAVNAAVRVDYGTREYTIDQCVVTGVPSYPGDSGSAMLDFGSHALAAVLFAGGVTSDGYGITIGCEATNVMQQLNIAPFPPPEMQRAFWLDLSHWQGDIQSLSDDMTGEFKANIEGLTPQSFSQMKAAGVQGVVIKAAQGADVIDPKFADYYAKAKAAGLRVAAYDYVDPRYSASEHFANWQRAVRDRELDFVAMDCEAASGQSIQVITAVIEGFGKRLQDWYGKLPWVYTSVGFWNQYVIPAAQWQNWPNYPLWIAFWSDKAYFPLLPEAWKGVKGQPVMWQFKVSNAGAYLGVASKQVDLNTMYQSGLQLIGIEPSQPPASGSASASASPSPSPSPSGEPGYAVFEHFKGRVVITTNLNIRSGPGTNFAKIGAIPPGGVVEILGTARDNSGNTWVRIGYVQWAAQHYSGQEYIRYILESE